MATAKQQLEQERGTESFSADRWRAAREEERGRLFEEFRKLTPPEGRRIMDGLEKVDAEEAERLAQADTFGTLGLVYDETRP